MTAVSVGAILALWAAIGLALTGVGVLAARAAGFRAIRPSFALPWIGWAVTLALLQIAQLFKPVDGTEQAIVAIAGLAGLFAAPGPLLRKPRVSWRTLWPGLAAIAVAAYSARHALVAPRAYDSGTYHLPTVLWFGEFPIVAGLGNLHVRLAFNHASLLFSTLLNVGLLKGFAINLSLGFFLSLVVATLVCAGAGVDAWHRHRALAAAALIAVPLVCAQIYSVAFEGLSPDVVLFCCGIEAVVLLLRLAPSDAAGDDRSLDQFALIVLAAAGCVVKPSFLVLGAGAAALSLSWRRPSARAGTVAAAIVIALLGTSVIRSIVLSGYPFFPLAWLPLPVPWRVPLETARENLGWIRAWARLVDDDSMRVPYQAILADTRWMRPWAAHLLSRRWDVSIPIVIAATALAASVAWRAARRSVRARYGSLVALPAAALAFWFVSAPDLRFAGAAFVALAMTTCAMLIDAASGDPASTRTVAAAVIATACLTGVLQIRTMSTWWRLWPAAERLGQLPSPETARFVTASGAVLRVPVSGEACWAAPPPCTPYPSPSLRWIDPAIHGKGFRIEPFDDALVVGWWTADRPWEAMKPPR